MPEQESTAERIASALELIEGDLNRIADMLELLAQCTDKIDKYSAARAIRTTDIGG